MEQIKTDGVVLKRTFVGEKDAIIKILTREAGLVSASVKGIKNLKSKLSAGAGIFRYSDFVLSRQKDRYIVTQSVQKEGFFGLSSNIERLSYAAYFAEITMAFTPSAEDANAILPLLLNTLYLLSNSEKDANLIKCVFELKLLSLLGYAPTLDACASCGETEALQFFSPTAGGILCASCIGSQQACILSEDTLSAMRFVQNADDKKAFSFALPPDCIDEFTRCTEKMLETIFSRPFASLTYLKQITGKI